jgi:para-nitrobenzyl esterase
MNKYFHAAAVPAAAIATLIVVLACMQCVPASAADMTPQGDGLLAIAHVAVKGHARLTVESPAFPPGGDIPLENTQYRGNLFPGFSWTRGPAATRSYVLIMQDPDAIHEGMPILHWTLLNIPAAVTKLEAGMKAPPAGSSYGPNIRGSEQPYLGPHTPPGPKHHYHVQLFALDTALGADAGASYSALTAAMTGHVLAAGELIGLGHADPDAPPRN